jgi:hypothetical protein
LVLLGPDAGKEASRGWVVRPPPAIISGDARQAGPWINHIKRVYPEAIENEPIVPLEEDNKSSCELSNGSRIVSLPGDPDTVRGYSAPRLVITDEAAYVSDAMQAALAPMLAVSRGRQIDMSSPNGRRGFYFENWTNGEDIERIRIVGRDCPRISAEFLAQQRKKLGSTLFAQEFEGEFTDADTSAFSSVVELALVDDFEPFELRAA